MFLPAGLIAELALPFLLLVFLVLFIALLLFSLLLEHVFLLDQALIPFSINVLSNRAFKHLLLERLDHLVKLQKTPLNIIGRLDASFTRALLVIVVRMR